MEGLSRFNTPDQTTWAIRLARWGSNQLQRPITKAFLQTPELREATKLHQDSIPTSKIQFNEDLRSEARRVSGKVVDIETAMNGEVSVFRGKSNTGSRFF